MAGDNFQNDFFEHEFFERKSKKPRLLSRYSRQRLLPYVRVPVEYVVISAIGVLVLTIISYAVGVERGKKMSAAEVMEAGERAVRLSAAGLEDGVGTGDGARSGVSGIVRGARERLRRKEMPLMAERTEESDASYAGTDSSAREGQGITGGAAQGGERGGRRKEEKPEEPAYIVQLASFKGERSAKREINKLKEKGVEAHLLKKGRWYQVYAAGYRTIEEARKAKRKLMADYEDCYIRKIR